MSEVNNTCGYFLIPGHIMISSYLINYFPNLDLERRNCHGFTALMKAAMQGRADVVRLLMMSGRAKMFSSSIYFFQCLHSLYFVARPTVVKNKSVQLQISDLNLLLLQKKCPEHQEIQMSLVI